MWQCRVELGRALGEDRLSVNPEFLFSTDSKMLSVFSKSNEP